METLKIKPRAFLPAMAVAAGVLLLVEVAFRVNGWFDDRAGWESPGLQKKMEAAERLYREEGRIDLFTLSTSVGRVWDVHQWEEATGGAMVAYNMGFPDQRPERQNFLFRKYLYPRYKPGYVIYGVSIPDTNSNSRGKHPDRPKDGPFWEFRQVRAIRADSLGEKISTQLEDVSALFRSRRRARFSLQFGEIAELPEDPTIGQGVIVPTIRRQPFGPMPESWALHPLGLSYNTYHNYWAPEEGEFGEIRKLAEFCLKKGVKFAVVEVPTSPYAHTNFDRPEDYGKFTEALDKLAAQGIEVLPMARDLKLGNTYFEDQEHLNRWGGQLVTDYVYQRLIRRWFPEEAMAESLPAPVEMHFADALTTDLPGVTVERRDPATADAQYAAERQVVVTEPVDITLTGPLAAGSYALELYVGDGSTTEPVLTGRTNLTLLAEPESGIPPVIIGLDEWIQSRVGVTYTQYHFTLTEPSVLKLKVEPWREPVVLDSFFLRRKLVSHGDGPYVE